jgi:hypothetical protein
MSAEAFTVGKDVYFRDGMPSTTAASGQALLAHELAHTLQPQAPSIHRFDLGRLNPFRDKTDAEKQAAEQKKQLEAQRKADKAAAKARLAEFEARRKAEDKQARADAKTVNAKNKQVATSVAGSYAGRADAKLRKSPEQQRLEDGFAALLEKERASRADAKQRTTAALLAQGRSASEAEAEGELAAERAADLTWSTAPVALRAFRPLRFDDFDKALNEVKQARLDDMALHLSDVGAVLAQNDADLGTIMKPDKAGKKVAEERALDRRRERIAAEKNTAGAALDAGLQHKTAEKLTTKLAETEQERGVPLPGAASTVSAGEQQRLQKKIAEGARQEAYGDGDQDLADHRDRVDKAGKGISYGGKAWKAGAKAFGTEGEDATDANALVGRSLGGVSGILALVSEIMSFVSQVKEIDKGGTDRGAGLAAASTAVGAFRTAATTTRAALLAIKDGITAFGGAASDLANATSALPIVGLIGSSLEVIQGALDVIPVGERLSGGAVSIEQARLEDKGPLVAALARGQRRNGQLLEKGLFDIAKGSTMIGLHIAEVASAGGFGIPAAAKLTLTLTGYGHKAAHAVYDQFVESRASDAKHAYYGAHDEGASRDLVTYDASTAVDLITVAAQKHQLPYAISWLGDYGITPAEVKSMRVHEIRAKVIKALKETDDPKSVTEKVDGAKKSVKEALGLDDKPGPKGEEKSTLDKVKEAPGKALDALLGLPEKISKKKAEIQGRYADAKELVAKKNQMGYKGKSDRGYGSATYNFLRGEDNVEKSYAKVRYDLKADGATGEMPYTRAEKEARDKLAKAKKPERDAGIAHHVDPAYVARLAKASVAELYAMQAMIKPGDDDQLALLSMEVDRRLQAAGMPAGRP